VRGVGNVTHMSFSVPQTQDSAAGRATSLARASQRVDASNERIPPDATASDGIQRVEVAGIEPGRMGVDLLARGADLRRCPEACRTQGDPLARSVDAVNGAGA